MGEAYLDLSVHSRLFTVVLLVLVWVHPDVVESKFLLDTVLKQLSLLQSETISLGNDRHHIHSFAQLLQHDNIDRLQRMAGGANEIQAAVDAGILNVPLSLRCKLLAQICTVLILNVLDNGIPATVVVHEVAIARCVNNVKAQTDAILFDDVRHGLNLGSLTDGFLRCHATLGVDKVRGEDGVDQG